MLLSERAFLKIALFTKYLLSFLNHLYNSYYFIKFVKKPRAKYFKGSF